MSRNGRELGKKMSVFYGSSEWGWGCEFGLGTGNVILAERQGSANESGRVDCF